ncbi:MAG: hypothetical protein BMS9Abin08_0742 [Gammaproteobacteria bacterium]|nr:MAG: hypothetical protein BMS9Abin08_0742 [Gammaproteobacteria bacterium]
MKINNLVCLVQFLVRFPIMRRLMGYAIPRIDLSQFPVRQSIPVRYGCADHAAEHDRQQTGNDGRHRHHHHDVVEACNRAMDAASGLNKIDDVTGKILQPVELNESASTLFVRQSLHRRMCAHHSSISEMVPRRGLEPSLKHRYSINKTTCYDSDI